MKLSLDLLLIGSTVLMFMGCSSLDRAIQKIDCDMRLPGIFRVKGTLDTMNENSCAYSTGMKFIILEETLSPPIAKPGEMLCQRIIYALCPSAPSQTYPVKIERILFYKGLEACRFTSTPELNPGTWNIDVKIPIPEDAATGVYALKTILTFQDKNYEKLNEFEVMTE